MTKRPTHQDHVVGIPRNPRQAEQASGGPAILVARDVHVSLGGCRILAGAGVEVRSGMVTGLVGPNGAGKSTLMLTLAGVHRCSAGMVHLGDDRLDRLSRRTVARRMGFVPQHTGVNVDFTVEELVALGRHPHLRRFQAPRACDHEAVRVALADTGITHLAGRTLPTLSGGERQLVHIAKALAQEPDVLLLDEPVASLDLGHQLDVLTLLTRQAALGRAVAVVLHDLNQAARFCDRLAVVHRGRVRTTGTPHEVLRADLLADIYGVTVDVTPDPRTGAPHVVALERVPPTDLEIPR